MFCNDTALYVSLKLIYDKKCVFMFCNDTALYVSLKLIYDKKCVLHVL